MKSFYFFTDTDLIANQAAGDAFGPLSAAAGNDRFQVTSTHSSTGTPNAYAICDGTVCVQRDNSNGSILHLILKPDYQPSHDFPKVKYFIYKGIKRNSLIASGLVLNTGINDLTESITENQNKINASIDKANGSSGTNTQASKLALGIDDTTIAASSSIDDVFFRENLNYQFPKVKGGWHIGDFVSGTFGLEIVLEKADYDPIISIARNTKHIIEVAQLTGSESQAQSFKHWHDKEEILSYVDPAAFFGSFYTSNLYAKTSTSSFLKVSRAAIYDELLKGLQHNSINNGNFFRRNTTYIDIRNNHNQSFDYFKDYGQTLSIAYDENSTPSSLNYYNSLWPCLMISQGAFSTTNTQDKNIVRLWLPRGENTLALAFVSVGFQLQKGNKFRSSKDKKKFVELSYDGTTASNKEIALQMPNRTGLSANTPIASLILLRYLKRLDYKLPQAPTSNGTVFRANSPLDHIFLPLSMNSPISGNFNIKTHIYDEEVFIDRSLDGKAYVGDVGVSVDAHNVTLFVLPKHRWSKRNLGGLDLPLTSEVSNSHNHFLALLEERFLDVELSKQALDIGGTNETIITSQVPEKSILNLGRFNRKDVEEPEFLVIERTTFDSLQSLATASGLITDYKVFVGTRNEVTTTDNNNIKYNSSELVIRGLKETSGVLDVTEVGTGLKVYSYAD